MNIMHFYITQPSRVHEGFAGPTQRGSRAKGRRWGPYHIADFGIRPTRDGVGASMVASSSWDTDPTHYHHGNPMRLGCTRAPLGVVPAPHMERWLP